MKAASRLAKRSSNTVFWNELFTFLGFIMKNVTLTSLATLVLLLCTSAVATLAKLFLFDFNIAFIIAAAILAVSGLLIMIIKRSTAINVICFFVSAVAFGIAMRGWFMFCGVDVGIAVLAIISLISAVLFFVFGVITRISLHTRKMFIYGLAIIIYILAGAITLFMANKSGNVYLSTLVFYLLSIAGFVFAVSVDTDDTERLIRCLALSTYSVLIAVIAIILIAVALSSGDSPDCDCDCCGDDCTDLWFEDSGDKRSKGWRKKKDYDEPDFGY